MMQQQSLCMEKGLSVARIRIGEAHMHAVQLCQTSCIVAFGFVYRMTTVHLSLQRLCTMSAATDKHSSATKDGRFCIRT